MRFSQKDRDGGAGGRGGEGEEGGERGGRGGRGGGAGVGADRERDYSRGWGEGKEERQASRGGDRRGGDRRGGDRRHNDSPGGGGSRGGSDAGSATKKDRGPREPRVVKVAEKEEVKVAASSFAALAVDDDN